MTQAPYDPAWLREFQALARVYLHALAGLAQRVEHVGSTAVAGLSAKPIIDIDVVIHSRLVLPEVVARLSGIGYRHQGDLGIPEREAFASNEGVVAPTDGSGRRWPAHNLYVCAADSEELRRHLRFRDWLRANAAGAAEYAKLKSELATAHGHDRDAYTRGKTAFVEAALRCSIHTGRNRAAIPKRALDEG